MQPAEAVLVHHIHPAKIGADITASVVSDVLLWKHKPRIAVAVRVLLPAAGSAAVLGLADLGALARTRPGQYVLDHMPPSAQAVRLAGDAVMGSRGLPPQPGPAAPRRGPSRGRLVSCGVAAAVQAPMTPIRQTLAAQRVSAGQPVRVERKIIQVTISRSARSAGRRAGHAKTEVALRDELPVRLQPRLAGFAPID